MTKHQATAPEILQMAILGFETQRNRIEAAIAEIQTRLRSAGIRFASDFITTTKTNPTNAGKRRLSAAGRKRIAEAQRKRWAAVKAKKGQAAKVKSKPARKGQEPVVVVSPKRLSGPPTTVTATKPKAEERSAPKTKPGVKTAPQRTANIPPAPPPTCDATIIQQSVLTLPEQPVSQAAAAEKATESATA